MGIEEKECTIVVEAQDVVFVLYEVINFFDDEGPKNDVLKKINLIDGQAKRKFRKKASHALAIVGTGKQGAVVKITIPEINFLAEPKVDSERRLSDMLAFNIIF